MTNNQAPTTTTHHAADGVRAAASAVTILPTAIADLVTVVSPRTARGRRADRGRLAWYAVRSVLLGLVAWILAGVMALLIVRGPFYGLVQSGPYDSAWGGPTRAGAWLAHFVISLPFGVICTLLLVGVTRTHRTMKRGLGGAPVPRWVTPVVLVTGAAAGLFVVAWTRQI